ncbi:hypothetical protein Sango_1254000 [Sesamum angolense]|uniref:Reverse transcriptase/retrotransposon-derived protein RNase H-like domain-containing protein n=1 Tax=Sesamum angolense TaxID=2727404 RepID=A0AAE1WQR7_9LAMI|nr:hypothetical protein Sango_1254000 [Sesamum angolense]
MKRQTTVTVSCGKVLKAKAQIVIFTQVQSDDEDDKENVASSNYISDGAKENIAQTYHITLIEDGEVEEEDAEDAPVELEEGIKATIDESKEVNLGDIENPRPIYISASLTQEEEGTYIALLHQFKDVFAWSYKEIPGLDPKNVGVTYQRAMQKIFDDMLHKNGECYIDDLVVKSKKRENYFHELRKVFECLRRYQLKVNPSKCVFGVTSGKFLGFIVRSGERSVGILLAQKNDEEKENVLYYLSRTMTPNELKYSPIEKLCLALIFSIQKLKQYFQSHSINLVSKANPLKYVMAKPVLSDRLLRLLGICTLMEPPIKKESALELYLLHQKEKYYFTPLH